MSRFGVLILATATLAVPATAQAQAQKGDKEVLLFGNVSTFISESTTFSSGTIFVNAGVFMSDTLEVGGGPTISISFAGDTTTFQTGVNAFFRKYTNAESTVAPYFGAEVSINDIAPDEPDTIANNTFLAGIAGIKNYFSERAALDIKGLFGFRANDPGAFQLLQINVGLTIVF
jgi:hypothetical protein